MKQISMLLPICLVLQCKRATIERGEAVTTQTL